MNSPLNRKNKSITLKSVKKEVSDSSNNDDVEESLVLIAKNFRKLLKFKKSQKGSKDNNNMLTIVVK